MGELGLDSKASAVFISTGQNRIGVEKVGRFSVLLVEGCVRQACVCLMREAQELVCGFSWWILKSLLNDRIN